MGEHDDVMNSRLCALLRREAERLAQERKANGFKNSELVDAVLVEAMSMTSGTSAQVRARLRPLVDEALLGPSHAKLPDLPPDASPNEMLARADALEAQGAAMRAEADAMARLLEEARRRGAGPDTPLSSVFSEAELSGLPILLQRAPPRSTPP